MKLFSSFDWRGTEQVITLPWLRNRIEYTADPARIRAFTRCPFTRSRLTMDMLTRFHLSYNSIVVSDDDHAKLMRTEFFKHMPTIEKFPQMGRELVKSIFICNEHTAEPQAVRLASLLIREVYLNLLDNLLGIEITKPIQEFIWQISFHPSRRPMHLNGLVYAFSQLLPGSAFMRDMVDLVYYKGERYTRKVATQLESLIFEYSVTRPESWYSALLDMKCNGTISNAQFRGELTSIFVSAYSLSAALCSMILCLAVRPQYISRIRVNSKLKECFVLETLRLFPPFRQFGYEHKITPESAPKSEDQSTDFMVAVYALHRNEKAWGDPSNFRPERFQERGAMGGQKFLPFGMGNRNCSGREYSMNLMIETLGYLCSEDCDVELSVPHDFEGDETGLPLGVSGRLISFPYDDRLTYRRVST